MCDYSEGEISALEEIFSGMKVYICDFHREQAWTRWSKKSENKLSHDEQEMFLSHMRSISYSRTWKTLCDRLNAIQGSLLWDKHENVKSYVRRYWFSQLDRWVKFYRNPLIDRSISTNNGVESLNKILKHMYLKYFCDRSVTGLVTMILNQFLPERYKVYVKENHKMSSQIYAYNEAIPSFLHNRPTKFVKHVLQRLSQSATIPRDSIEFIDEKDGKFAINSMTPGINERYNINLQNPSCNCFDFLRSTWPCKHILAVFNHSNLWSWEDLPD